MVWVPGPHDLLGTDRQARGLGPSKDELLWVREPVARSVDENRAGRAAG
jgi:hypothetical protein